MRIMIKTLLSSLLEKKARTFLVLFSIAVSAALIFANESFATTLTQRFYEADVRWSGVSDLSIETRSAVGASEWIDPAKLAPYQDQFEYVYQFIREKALYNLSQGSFQDWTGNNIIIGTTYANRYHLKVGDTMKLELNNAAYEFKIIGTSSV